MISRRGNGSKAKYPTLVYVHEVGATKPNGRAMALCGVEGYEEVSVMIRGDRSTIIADVETVDEPAYGEVLGSCLGRTLHYVYYCLTKEVGVDGYCKRCGEVDSPLYGGIHTSEA